MVSSKASRVSATDPSSFATLERIPKDPSSIPVRQLKGALFAIVRAKLSVNGNNRGFPN